MRAISGLFLLLGKVKLFLSVNILQPLLYYRFYLCFLFLGYMFSFRFKPVHQYLDLISPSPQLRDHACFRWPEKQLSEAATAITHTLLALYTTQQ